MLLTKPQEEAYTKSHNHFREVKALIHTPRKQWDVPLRQVTSGKIESWQN